MLLVSQPTISYVFEPIVYNPALRLRLNSGLFLMVSISSLVGIITLVSTSSSKVPAFMVGSRSIYVTEGRLWLLYMHEEVRIAKHRIIIFCRVNMEVLLCIFIYKVFKGLWVWSGIYCNTV